MTSKIGLDVQFIKTETAAGGFQRIRSFNCLFEMKKINSGERSTGNLSKLKKGHLAMLFWKLEIKGVWAMLFKTCL